MTPWTIHEGDALAVLKTLPDASVQCCVTSPPYWGLRDYGTGSWEGGDGVCVHQRPATSYNRGFNDRWGQGAGERKQEHKSDAQYGVRCEKCGAQRIDAQLGLEATPDLYIGRMVEVFVEVHRVLREDGTLWLNLGDSYCAAPRGSASPGTSTLEGAADAAAPINKRARPKTARAQVPDQKNPNARVPTFQPNRAPIANLKPKDLVGIPWRVALALQAWGWWLRSDIIWSKPNPMPESIKDRPTKAHEYVFLLTKSERYVYDAASIAEPATCAREARWDPGTDGLGGDDRRTGKSTRRFGGEAEKRNARTVWTIATEPFPGAHFATFPTKLVEPCILAGAPKGATVLDPFSGAGTTGLVAHRLGRAFVGIELNPAYAAMARRRITDDCPLFASESRSA